MMTVVCSFLFPMGLQGVLFVSSARAAWGLTLGNLYALVLKLVTKDVEVTDPEKHAIRRSRPAAVTYMLSAPVLWLGIALTGLGFMARSAPSNRLASSAPRPPALSPPPFLSSTLTALASCPFRR